MTRTAQTILLLIGLTALLAACGGGGSNNGIASQQNSAGISPIAGLPPIPHDEQVPMADGKSVSVQITDTINGHSTEEDNGTFVSPNSLRLQPADEADTKFAIYRLKDLHPDVSFSTLELVLADLTTGGEYYLALADYSTGRWAFFSRTAPGSSMTIDLTSEFDAARNVSPGGNAFLAVVVNGAVAEDCLVDRIERDFTAPLGTPQDFDATDGLFDTRVSLFWRTVTGATGHEVFYKLAEEPDSEYELLARIENPVTNFLSHEADVPAGKGALYDTVYEYRVRAFAGLETGEFTEGDTGFRKTPKPEVVTLQRGRSDAVEVTLLYTQIPKGETVDIFRKQGDLPKVKVVDGDLMVHNIDQVYIDDFSDVPEPIPGPLEYTAIVNGLEGPSDESDPVTGCIAEWEDDMIAGGDPTLGFYADLDDALGGASGPAFTHWLETPNEIRYSVIDGESTSSVKVADAQTNKNLALENHAGRPWVAYLKTDLGGDGRGLFVARGSSADPTDGGSFSTMHIFDGIVLGVNVRMEEINGRLVAMFAGELGGGRDAIYIARAKVVDPQQASDWAVIELHDYPEGGVAEEFDLVELDGRVAGLILDTFSVLFFCSRDQDPLEDGDFFLVNAVNIDQSTYTPPQAVDAFIDDNGRIQGFVLYGDTEEDILVGWVQSDQLIPDSFEFWFMVEIQTFFDRRIRDMAFVEADDGYPLVVIRDADNDWPTMLRPHIGISGGITFQVPWAAGQIFPNEQFRDIDQFSNSGIRAMFHNGQVKVLSDREFFEISTVHQLNLLTLKLKPEL